MKATLKDGTELKISVVQKAINEDDNGLIKTNIFMKTSEAELDTAYDILTTENIKEIKFEREDGKGYTDHFTRLEQVSQRLSDTEDIINITLA